jgi:transcriptional regulator of acetoin/glycerol metabolism
VRYGWHGNVRELSNVMERAVILCQDGVIQPVDLPQQVNTSLALGLSQPPCCPDTSDDCLSGFSSSKSRIMANFERKELERYLKNAQGNVSEACRLSGIPRRTFYRKMRTYGL